MTCSTGAPGGICSEPHSSPLLGENKLQQGYVFMNLIESYKNVKECQCYLIKKILWSHSVSMIFYSELQSMNYELKKQFIGIKSIIFERRYLLKDLDDNGLAIHFSDQGLMRTLDVGSFPC